MPSGGVHALRTVLDGLVRIGRDASLPLEHLRGKRVLAFSGIARPARFFAFLEASGAILVRRLPFPDHFAYPAKARTKIAAAFEASGAELAVTTEKDAVKLDPPDGFPDGFPIFVLRIKLELPAPFFERVRESLRKHGLGMEPWPASEA